MLKMFDLFSGLSESDLKAIEGISRKAIFQRGETIFTQGDAFEDFFIIESGQVEISMTDAFQGKKVITVLRNHDFFGEMGLFDKNSIRSATARALQATTLFIIPGPAFEKLLNEKPALSVQLLNTLSKRLKEANIRVALAQAGVKQKDGRILSVASARNGCGKTAFATTLANLMANELPRTILYVDLDLYYGDGTYYMGISTSKTITDMIGLFARDANPAREAVLPNLVRHSENLYTLAAPSTFLEAEEFQPLALVPVLKGLRSHFDYLILDTDSTINELFLNALDLSDLVFFLADMNTPIMARNNARYFQTLARLNFPPERINLIAARVAESLGSEKIAGMMKSDFRFRILGGLPQVKGSDMDFSRTYYQTAPEGPYCGVMRHFLKTALKEEPQLQKAGGTFFQRFFSKNDRAGSLILGTMEGGKDVDPLSLRPGISETSILAAFQGIRERLVAGDFENAQEELLNLLELCPESGTAYQYLGEVFLAQRNHAEAISAFKRALELAPEQHMALAFLGHLTTNEELFTRGNQLLKIRLEAHPGYPDLHNDAGKIAFLKGRNDQAVAAFQKALEINPHFQEARVNLAIALGELQKFHAAVQELLGITPKSLRVHYLLGRFFYNLERFREAREAFNLGSEINPMFLDLADRLDRLNDYFRQVQVLVEKYLELLKAHPEFPDVHFNLGDLYFRSGEYDLAQKEVQEALRLNAKYSGARALLEEIRQIPRYDLKGTAPQKTGGETAKPSRKDR